MGTEDWSSWAVGNELAMAAVTSGQSLAMANATARYVSDAATDLILFLSIVFEVTIFVGLTWTVAWLVGGSDMALPLGQKEPDADEVHRRRIPRILRPIVSCARVLFGCCTPGNDDASDIAAPPLPSIRFTLREVMATAAKIIETFKIISVLYVFLNAQGIANMVCDTPSVLMARPGWGVVTSVSSYLGRVRMYPGHWVRWLNYTAEEAHAVVAVYSATVDYAWFNSVVIFEVVSLTVTLGTWGAVQRFSWAQLYGWLSFFLSLVWAFYELHMYLQITLLDNGESFMCTVPYLYIVTRSFTYMHVIISAFYFGLAIGLGDCALCGLCPNRRGVRYCTVRRKRHSRDEATQRLGCMVSKDVTEALADPEIGGVLRKQAKLPPPTAPQAPAFSPLNPNRVRAAKRPSSPARLPGITNPLRGVAKYAAAAAASPFAVTPRNRNYAADDIALVPAAHRSIGRQ